MFFFNGISVKHLWLKCSNRRANDGSSITFVFGEIYCSSRDWQAARSRNVGRISSILRKKVTQ